MVRRRSGKSMTDPARRGPGLPVAVVLVAAGAVAWAAPAIAATGGAAPSEGLLLAQIVIVVVLARGVGELMLRLGQPAVMGHLLAGIVLGPSVFGLLWPAAEHVLFPPSPGQKAMIAGLSNFGILMLLLLAGME